MATVFVTHHVKDFDVWRPFFDEEKDARNDAGIRLLSMYRGVQDPNEISILFEVDDLDVMNKLMSSDEMQDKVKESGVDSEIKVTIMNRVQ